MKGLLIKDFRQIFRDKKVVIIMLFMSCFFLATMNAEQYVFVTSYFTMICAVLTINTVTYDEMDNGLAYIFTMPVSRKQYAVEKIMMTFIMTILGALLSSLISFAIAMIKHSDIDFVVWFSSIGASTLCIFLLVMFMLPIQAKFGVEKARIAILVLVFIVIGGAMFVSYIADKMNLSIYSFLTGFVEKLIDMPIASIVLGGVAVLAAIILIVYNILVKIMEHKEL